MKYQLLWILFAFTLIRGSNSTDLFRRLMSFLRILIYDDDRPQVCDALKYEIPCGKSMASKDKIVGGEDAEPGEFPWLVSLQIYMKSKDKYDHNCGGSVINSKWILTAAHCVYDIPQDMQRIAAGEFDLTDKSGDEQYRKIVNIVYSRYDEEDYRNDIALLELDEPLELDGENVAPICIPDENLQFKRNVEIAGWGRLKSDGELPNILQKVEMNMSDIENCRSIYTRAGYDYYLHGCQICTEPTRGKDSCQGDSGGPLMCMTPDDETYYACGIASWGVGCASPKYPGMYTNVECFTDWITKNVQGTC